MTAVVKKKIVEKLARFTKDLKPSDISLSFLTGKAVLQKIELNADFLTEILHLPLSLQISKVVCDRIKADVPFTSLGTNPIQIMINKVEVEVASCDGVAPRTKQFNDLKLGNNSSSSSSYGYVDKVVDGMKVSIQSIVLKFRDPTFEASVEVANVVIQSMTPQWKQSADLKGTRFKNEEEDYVIIYKMCSWDSVKMEGVSLPNMGQDKLRLVSQETAIRLALKRKISDCSILHTRVSIHLGDLICVLTQSQLRASSHVIQRLVEAALNTESAVEEEQEKKATSNPPVPHSKDSKSQKQSNTPNHVQRATISPIQIYQDGKANLLPHLVIQNSFHLKCGKVDLHLDDDVVEQANQHGGRMNIVIEKVMLDVYPDQGAKSGRHHWNKANDLIKSNVKWSAEMLGAASRSRDGTERDVFVSQNDLREMGVVFRCGEFAVNAVRKKVLPLITSDKSTFKIPDDDDNPAIQVGITIYTYPKEKAGKFLVPRPNAYIYMSPIHINFHQESILWLAEFVHGVIATVNVDLAKTAVVEGNAYLKSHSSSPVSEQKQVGIDIKFRLLFSKITLPIPDVLTDGRPKALQIETSSIDIKNCALGKVVDDRCFRSAMEWLRKGWVFKTHFSKEFPHFADDFEPFSAGLLTMLRNHFPDKSHPQASTHDNPALRKLDLMSVEVWQVETACVSVSFPESYSHDATLRPKQFVRDFPLQLWLFPPPLGAMPTPEELIYPKLSFLLHLPQPLHVTLERLQFLFLLDVKESLRNFQFTLVQLLTLGNRSSPSLPISTNGTNSTSTSTNGTNSTSTSTNGTNSTSTSTNGTSSTSISTNGTNSTSTNTNGTSSTTVTSTSTTSTSTSTSGTSTNLSSPSSDTSTSTATKGSVNGSQSQSLKDSVSIGGCVIINTVNVEILLPTLFSSTSPEAVKTVGSAQNETEMYMELDSKVKDGSTPLHRPTSLSSLLASEKLVESSTSSSPFPDDHVSDVPTRPATNLSRSFSTSSITSISQSTAYSPFGSTINLSTQHEGPNDEDQPGDLHSLCEDTASIAEEINHPLIAGSSLHIPEATCQSSDVPFQVSSAVAFTVPVSSYVSSSSILTSTAATTHVNGTVSAVVTAPRALSPPTPTSLAPLPQTLTLLTPATSVSTPGSVQTSTPSQASSSTHSAAPTLFSEDSDFVVIPDQSTSIDQSVQEDTYAHQPALVAPGVPPPTPTSASSNGSVAPSTSRATPPETALPATHSGSGLPLATPPGVTSIATPQGSAPLTTSKGQASPLTTHLSPTRSNIASLPAFPEGQIPSDLVEPNPETPSQVDVASDRLSVSTEASSGNVIKPRVPKQPIHGKTQGYVAPPPYVLLIHVENVGLLPNITPKGISLRGSVDYVELEEVKADHRPRNIPPVPNDSPEECVPVVKLRFELGDRVSNLFPGTVPPPKTAAMIKVDGLDATFWVPNLTYLKDFFEDEYVTDDPLPVHIRVDNTSVVMRDLAGDTADNPHSMRIQVHGVCVHRGPRLEGVNTFVEDAPSVAEERLAEGNAGREGNGLLKDMFKSFISVFDAHVQKFGEVKLPYANHIAGLLYQLKAALSGEASEERTDAVSAVHPRWYKMSSVQTELQRLRKENENLSKFEEENRRLTQQLVDIMAELDKLKTENAWLVSEVRAKQENILTFRQLIEKQHTQIESLVSDRDNCMDDYSIAKHQSMPPDD